MRLADVDDLSCLIVLLAASLGWWFVPPTFLADVASLIVLPSVSARSRPLVVSLVSGVAAAELPPLDKPEVHIDLDLAAAEKGVVEPTDGGDGTRALEVFDKTKSGG
jgi:hypothetical protein